MPPGQPPGPPGGYPPGAGFPPAPGPYPQGAPIQATPVQKKGCSTGCWIAIAVVGGLGLIVCGIAGFIFWRVSQDPDVKKAFNVVAGGVELIKDAQSAKGTDDLKDLGCRDPMVFDVDKLLDFAEETSEGKNFKRPKADVKKLVVCNASKSLTCEEVAEEYVDAAKPKNEFAVVVNSTSATENCSERFDEDGESLGSFASGSVPVPTVPQSSE